MDTSPREVGAAPGDRAPRTAQLPGTGVSFDPAAVQLLLADGHRPPVTVSGWERLEPWAVARVWLTGAGAPRSVIAKWVRTDPAGTRTEPWRLLTEVAALQFLSDDLGLALAPRVIAADPRVGLVVLEDLAPRVALDQLLRRDGVLPHVDRMAAFARARGELSAATAGHADRYYARRSALGPVDPAADRAGQFAWSRDEAREHAAALGAPITGRAESELVPALDELDEPGPFLALSNGDAETNNFLVHEGDSAGGRLIDFEAAGYAHALADAVCLYVPGPAWMSVGDPVGNGLADEYRRALVAGVPEAADDRRYGFGLAAACLSWALIRLQRFVMLDSRAPGDDSRLQLVATLESAAHTADVHRALSHLSGWACRTAELLRRRWPDTDRDYTDPTVFPPYLPRH